VKKFIIVKTSFEGFHYWKDAPIEVGFLKNLHRHIFYVEAKISVSHSNRALEFFTVQHFIEDHLINKFRKLGCNLKEMSCEMIAEEILNAICIQYRIKKGVSVTVSEDGENAGGVEI